MSAATYHILDVDLTLRAPPSTVAAFDLLYGRLRMRCDCEICRRLDRTACLIEVKDGPAGRCEVHSPWGVGLVDPDRVLSHLFFLLQHHVIGGVHGFFALHGAALTIDGRGCVLAAPSATGKTTLAAALVQRGAGFLSDEVAALDLHQPVLHGFYRHFAVRQPTLPLLDLEGDPTIEVAGETKSVIDPDRLGDGGVRTCTSPDVVILLAPPRDPSVEVAADEQVLEIFLLVEGEDFVARVEAIDGVRLVERLADRRCPGLRIVHAAGSALIERIEAGAQATGTLLSGHHRGASMPIDYGLAPRWEALEAGPGLMQLLPALLNRNGLRRLGSPGLWLVRLSRLLVSTRFYRMTPGRLVETVAAVEKLSAPPS